MTESVATTSEIRNRLGEVMLADRFRLRRRIEEHDARLKANKPVDQITEKIQAHFAASAQRRARRIAQLPALIEYPEELPVAAHRETILEAIANHQVVILAGDTGSGKTTQLPKMCLQLGRGVDGLIGHTQPRRIAAQAVATRIAEELGSELGDRVGFQVRFTDRSSETTLVKVMTDGILLAEIQHDRRLERYDTIIIDEAHERSLNIDFLLGYLKRLLPERPDLKIIVTSATIDVERFSAYFDDAPVIEVSGRTYPVDVWYRPPPSDDVDVPRAIVDAVNEIIEVERASAHAGRGDILVFHAGERDIRETALELRKANIPHLDVLPLYSRLSRDEQARVLQPPRGGGRRVVLATNVAETSLTVPGIRYVVDPGFARISRYSVRSKVQQLPIEPISQASADQRKGRCGRVADGICVRLYSEEDFLARPAFTEPEILRTGLASVILQMNLLGLGDIARFPFIESPDSRQINDGVRLLEEIGALKGKRLTDSGRKLARLPVDPRIARMLLVSAQLGSLREMLVIASFLSVQDPRDRPVEKQQAADQAHRRFYADNSDFIGTLNLWTYAEEQRQQLTASQFRRLCKKEFLNWLRLREWRDIHFQLRLICKDLGLKQNTDPADDETVGRAIVAGMLSQIGTLTEERDYEGVRGRRFSIHPASSLFKKKPKWIVAAELVETTRLYARGVGAIDPEWVFPWAEHLVKREHYSPHWSIKRGKVLATERVRLFGLVVSDSKRVDYARIDPVEARRIFIQSALVEAQYKSKHRFWEHNRGLLAEIEALESKGRRRDLLVEDQVIFDFYAERLPADVFDHPTLDKWVRSQLKAHPDVLCMPRELLLRRTDVSIGQSQFPDRIECGDVYFKLSYNYQPGAPDDGVTVIVPVALLDRLPRKRLEWLVPGLLRDKLIALLKTLPKTLRKPLVPVPDTADMLMGHLHEADISLTGAIADVLRQERRLQIPEEAWDRLQLDAFYRMNVRIVDARNKVIAEGRDVDNLLERFVERGRNEVRAAAPTELRREGLQRWDIEALPETVPMPGNAGVNAWPALSDDGDFVSVRLCVSAAEAIGCHRAGVRRLILLVASKTANYFRRNLLRDARTMLRLGVRFRREDLVEDLLLAAVDQCMGDATLPRNQDDFNALVLRVENALGERVIALEAVLAKLSQPLADLHAGLQKLGGVMYQESVRDIRAQLDALLCEGFLIRTPEQWQSRLPLYLQAIAVRAEKLPSRLPRDLECVWELQQLQQPLQELSETRLFEPELTARISEYRWMLEEYRISLFAQQIGTRMPVSRKRLDKLWADIKRAL